jgi:hypothetical protein
MEDNREMLFKSFRSNREVAQENLKYCKSFKNSWKWFYHRRQAFKLVKRLRVQRQGEIGLLQGRRAPVIFALTHLIDKLKHPGFWNRLEYWMGGCILSPSLIMQNARREGLIKDLTKLRDTFRMSIDPLPPYVVEDRPEPPLLGEGVW